MEIVVFIIIIGIYFLINHTNIGEVDTSVETKEDTTTVNNFNIEQNTYIQQNNYYNSPKEQKSHSETVWMKLGYKVQYGETYAYKIYGREIFTPEQVIKIGSSQKQLSLESGLTKNQQKVKQLGYSLVNKYKSKRKAKDILVEEYDFDEETAKFAAGYRGYENW